MELDVHQLELVVVMAAEASASSTYMYLYLSNKGHGLPVTTLLPKTLVVWVTYTGCV